MWLLLILPFLLQMVTIGVDEGVFHIKRGLPKWERIGHPLDTLSLILCMLIVVFLPFSQSMLSLYCICALISCLMVTKDEFVHKHHCPALEHWLHACLFLLHPITLFAAAIAWPITQELPIAAWLMPFATHPQALTLFLKIQTLMMTLFFIYQVVFWNFIWRNHPVKKN